MTSSDAPEPIEMPTAKFRSVDALRFGWRQFKRETGGWIALQLVVAAISVAVMAPLLVATTDWQSDEFYDRDPLSILGYIAMSLILGVTTASLVKAALIQSSGGRPAVGESLSVFREPQVWLLSAIVAVLSEAAEFLLIGSSVLVAILTVYAWMYVIDAGQGAGTALLSGLVLIRRNLVPNLILAFLSALVFIVGVLACLVGLFVAIPVLTLAYVYAYRSFSQPPTA